MTTESVTPPKRLVALELDHLKCEKCGNKRKPLKSCFFEFTRYTSVHGAKYLGQVNRPIWEKLFWILSFALSIYFCISIILNIWYKWMDSPLLVSFNNKESEIRNIPFPSVTICPETKCDGELFDYDGNYQLIGKNGALTDTEREYLAALQHVCGPDINLFNLTFLPSVNIFDTLKSLSPTPIKTCVWRNKIVDCRKIFKQISTDEGICYNFNGLSSNDLYRMESLSDYQKDVEGSSSTMWHRDIGYIANNNNRSDETFPRRAAVGKNGLVVFLAEKKTKKDFLYKQINRGYRVLLHSPDNVPQVTEKFFFLPLGEAVTAVIHPGLLMTPSSLKRYTPEKRMCFFSDERYLKHFKIYTQNNCRLECVTNFSLSTCKCVHFSMPRVNSTPICNVKQLECYVNATYDLLLAEFERQVLNEKTSTGCNCMPPCTNIEYNAETTQTKFSTERFFSSIYFNVSSGILAEDMEYSKLQVIFKESEYLASKRAELYGLAELLSNWGGILGLFMGISVISFVEMFYFSAIRTVINQWILQRSEYSIGN